MSEVTQEASAAAVKWLTRLGRSVTEASVRELAPYMSGPKPAKGSLEARAFAHLVRRGKTPTPAAIAEWVAGWERRDAFMEVLKSPGEPQRAAAFVDSVVRETGAGPLWSELSAAMGWPRALTTTALKRLEEDGWVQFTTESRSLRAGARWVGEQS